MTKIYLIRHAEAEGNLYRRVQGHYDGRITPRGRAQIAALARRFRDIPIDAVYASDLQRTQVTAGAILETHPGLHLEIEPGLKEVCMGVWEDTPWGNVAHDQPEQLAYFTHDPAKWQVEGSESLSHLTARLVETVTRLARAHDGQTIALFSHGMAIRAFLCAVEGIPSSEVSRMPHGDNTAVSLLTYDGERFHVEFSNDNSHLAAENLSTFARQTWWKEASGADTTNLRLVPLDIETEKQLYIDSYAGAWRAAHGSLEGFDSRPYWISAVAHQRAYPQAIMKAYQEDAYMGLVELDTRRAEELGAGWITLCYLTEEARGRGLGCQLLGHALHVYRELGRRSVRLHVAGENARALAFYRHNGFEKIGQEPGIVDTLYLMERPV